jgi:hypothetical protein
VLRPALRKSGIAVVVDRRKVVKRGREIEEEVWDYQGVAFHAFRKACSSLLLAHGKTPQAGAGLAAALAADHDHERLHPPGR